MIKLNMPRSIKVLLVTFFGFIAFLLAMKFLLQSNEWLYIRVATLNSKEKVVEKLWHSLEGRWYVSNTDDSTNAAFEVDDKSWKTERYIYIGVVKGMGEIKWFRKHFVLKSIVPADTLLVRLSLFDNQSKVYVNGMQVQDTGFIYNGSICFKVPAKYFKLGNNALAVKALPHLKNAGVVTHLKDEILVTLQPSVSLVGSWKFITGDNYSYGSPNYNDSVWKRLYVPKSWDNQGYKKFDGIAWYRKNFTCPENYKNQELVFICGKIDDFNEIYINGVKIGGNIFRKFVQQNADDWANYVIYKFNGALLKDSNVVSVRVFDAMAQGGIYEGPVGIMPLNDYYNFYK